MQQKENYQILFDEQIKSIQNQPTKPSLLLHACCAPCSSYVLEYLSDIFDITLFFFNPNIAPKEEYAFRANELKRLVKEMGLDNKVKILIPDYSPEVFDMIALGREDLPERGARCTDCYRIRLEKSFLTAEERGFDFFSTTLSISPHKDAERLNNIGKNLAENSKTNWLFSDFKKKNGYKRSIELSQKYSLYRQNYCGCSYSKK